MKPVSISVIANDYRDAITDALYARLTGERTPGARAYAIAHVLYAVAYETHRLTNAARQRSRFRLRKAKQR